MKKPITTTVDWEAPDAEEPAGEQITKRGRHHMADFLAEKKLENKETRERYLRNFGGRDLDPRRVPRPDQVDSGRTWKSESRIRRPSRLFLENYQKIDWSA